VGGPYAGAPPPGARPAAISKGYEAWPTWQRSSDRGSVRVDEPTPPPSDSTCSRTPVLVAVFVHEGPLDGGPDKVVDDADCLCTASLAFRTHPRLILCVAHESAGCGLIRGDGRRTQEVLGRNTYRSRSRPRPGAPPRRSTGLRREVLDRLGVRQCARHVHATPIRCSLGARTLCATYGVHPATSVTRRNAPTKSAPCSHGDRHTSRH
jgi:hypothetical protein